MVRDGRNVLRSISRPGAGGRGTPITVFSATSELAEEAKALVHDRIDEITAEAFREMKEMPKGWIPFKLSGNPIRFIGFEECGFSLPAPPLEVGA